MSRQFQTGISGPPNNGDLVVQPQGGRVVIGNNGAQLPSGVYTTLDLRSKDEYGYGPVVNLYLGGSFQAMGSMSTGPDGFYVQAGPSNTDLVLQGARSTIIRSPSAVRFTVTDTAATSTVPVVLPADPSTALQAATKQYVDARNGALGIIAVGSGNGGAPTSIGGPGVWGTVTNTLNAHLNVGRRYRVFFCCRAVSTGNGAAADSGVRLSINPSTPWGERHFYVAGIFEGFSQQWVLDGDNTDHAFNVVMQSSNARLDVYTDNQSYPGATLFYVEDVGPNT